MLPEVKAQLIEQIVNFIFALFGGGIAATVITLLATRKQRQAETEQTKAQAKKALAEAQAIRAEAEQTLRAGYGGLVTQLQTQVKNLSEQVSMALEEINTLKAEIERYKRMVVRLFEWIRNQGLEPPSVEELEHE